ncbi:hypothetical protein TUM3794_20280 [Shewanella colwelliana]|uniref:Uncharacterized protein n=1 Tax=Shewanella colwelliana TaxID=23 RepID=A0ABQ4P0G7_SHECO|nr:hypothetical protein [Shewanella colwelliana]GIU40986.1 hypothetical protein TUM3794_20280 [Shewanella colwelliana]
MSNEKSELCEALAKSLVALGTKETLSIVSRFLIAIAFHQRISFEFDCTLGKLNVETISLNGENEGQNDE